MLFCIFCASFGFSFALLFSLSAFLIFPSDNISLIAPSYIGIGSVVFFLALAFLGQKEIKESLGICSTASAVVVCVARVLTSSFYAQVTDDVPIGHSSGFWAVHVSN